MIETLNATEVIDQILNTFLVAEALSGVPQPDLKDMEYQDEQKVQF